MGALGFCISVSAKTGILRQEAASPNPNAEDAFKKHRRFSSGFMPNHNRPKGVPQLRSHYPEIQNES